MCNQIEIEEQVNKAVELLACQPAGAARIKLMKEFGISRQEVDDCIILARKELLKEFRAKRVDIAAMAYHNLMRVYYEAENARDKIKSQEVIMELIGLEYTKSNDERDEEREVEAAEAIADSEEYADESAIRSQIDYLTHSGSRAYDKELTAALKKAGLFSEKGEDNYEPSDWVGQVRDGHSMYTMIANWINPQHPDYNKAVAEALGKHKDFVAPVIKEEPKAEGDPQADHPGVQEVK